MYIERRRGELKEWSVRVNSFGSERLLVDSCMLYTFKNIRIYVLPQLI